MRGYAEFGRKDGRLVEAKGEYFATASSLVTKYGAKLVGRVVDTAKYGEWPGGCARVVGLAPDPEAAPEIVLEVEHLEEACPDDPERGPWRVGVFEHEDVVLLDEE